MFYGMSSVKEYWKRARSNDTSDFATSSSDCSFDDSNSSSSKEYRDAGCGVDFDDTDEPIDENLPNVTNKLTNNIGQSSATNGTNKNIVDKSSRYVRWNVLMALGIGLWAVLCIVDFLHSEKSMTRDWFYESVWGKKMITKIELPKKLENPVFWYSNLWPYLWKIMTITTSGGVYVLLFLLMIAFCSDPRLRNSIASSSTKNNVSTKISHPRQVNNSIIEKKSLNVENRWLSRRFEDQKIPKFLSIRLELITSMDLQRKILFTIEKCVQADSMKFNDSPMSETVNARVVEIFDDSANRRNESFACLSISDERLVVPFDTKNRPIIEYLRNEKMDWPMRRKNDTIVNDFTSLCLMSTRRRSDLNFNAGTFDSEICEYLVRTRNILIGNSFARSREKRRSIINFRPKVSSSFKETKTRIITSSPAFKKFLFGLRRNSGVS